ncbi:hypothetical protein Tco_0571625 [Tanacetum coccineum]
MCRPSTDPSRQEEFEHIVTNFILDQEERITQLEDYMQVTIEEFMELSSEVVRRLKERIMENENNPKKIEKIIKYPDTKVLENNTKHNFFENLEKKMFPTPVSHLCIRYVRLIPSNPSQPRKNIFRFKPGKRANQSHHNPSNSPTIQPPTQSIKERIKENENKPRKIKKITKYQDTKVLENSAKYEFLENLEKKTFPTSTNLLCDLSNTTKALNKQVRSVQKDQQEVSEDRRIIVNGDAPAANCTS